MRRSRIIILAAVAILAVAIPVYIDHTKVKGLPDLPEPVTNNAVAVLPVDDGQALFSFMGLGSGKTYADVHSKA